jgi:hypothetical protein
MFIHLVQQLFAWCENTTFFTMFRIAHTGPSPAPDESISHRYRFFKLSFNVVMLDKLGYLN